jgi:hypothetical protein
MESGMETEEISLVALAGIDGETPRIYEILEKGYEEGEAFVKLKNTENGTKLRVHSSRVVKDGNKVTGGIEMAEAAEKAQEKTEEAEEKVEEQEEPKQAEQAEKPKKAKKKAKKAKKEAEPFDIDAFVAANGGEHWVKGKTDKIKFDHKGFEVLSHAVLDEEKKVYVQFNTYSSNGVSSLGRTGKGVTTYPLKGKTIDYTVSESSKKAAGEKRQRKGSKTAEEVRKLWEKKGYEKQ